MRATRAAEAAAAAILSTTPWKGLARRSPARDASSTLRSSSPVLAILFASASAGLFRKVGVLSQLPLEIFEWNLYIFVVARFSI